MNILGSVSNFEMRLSCYVKHWRYPYPIKKKKKKSCSGLFCYLEEPEGRRKRFDQTGLHLINIREKLDIFRNLINCLPYLLLFLSSVYDFAMHLSNGYF